MQVGRIHLKKRLINLFKNKKKDLFRFITIHFIQSSEASLNPYLIKQIIDSCTIHHGQTITNDQSIWFLGEYLIISLAYHGITRYQNQMSVGFYLNLKQEIIQTIYRHICIHKYQQSIEKPAAIAKKIQDVTTHCENLCHTTCDILFPKLVTIIGIIYTMCLLFNPKFSACLLIWSIVFIGLAARSARKLLPLTIDLTKEQHRLNLFLIRSIKKAHHNTLHKQKKDQINQLEHHLQKSIKRHHFLQSFKLKTNNHQSMATVLLISLLISALILEARQQQISPGDFSMIINLSVRLITTTQHIGFCLLRYARSLGACHNDLSTLEAME